MIDKEVKRKIEQKEEISSTELIQYFKQSPTLIEKGLFKRIRQRRNEKKHQETQQYLLDNFDTIMSTMSTSQLAKFLWSFRFFCTPRGNIKENV